MQESSAEVNSNKKRFEMNKCDYLHTYVALPLKHLVLLQEKNRTMLKLAHFRVSCHSFHSFLSIGLFLKFNF